MKEISLLILFLFFNLSISTNLFFQWRLTDSEIAQLKEESIQLFKSNYDLYKKLINNYITRNDKSGNIDTFSKMKDDAQQKEEPNLYLSRYTHCLKCMSFVKSIKDIKNKYGYKGIYDSMKINICPLIKSKMDIDVCHGFIDGYGAIILENFFSRYIDSHYLCEKVDLCPVLTQKKFVNPDLYANRVLKGKNLDKKRENINEERKVLRMLQVTDLHYDPHFKEGSSSECNKPICCREEPTEDQKKRGKIVGKYGFEGKCDIGEELFKSFVEDSYGRKVDFVIWTGDNAPHDTWQGSQKGVFDISKKLKDMLDVKFKANNIPVYYSLGNHEKYPNDAFHDEENYMLENMANVYRDYLNEEAYDTFKKYGYYSINYDKNLKIISINCLVCDSFNFNLFNSTKLHAKKMFSWLEEELSKAEQKNEYVYILNHFPLNGEFTLTECAKRFQALFDRYEYNIRGIFSGHTHRDDIEAITSYFDKNKIINLNFVAPQLTTYSNKLPSYRIYTIDADTKQVLDYEQYRFDLNKSNEEKKPYWNLAYKASQFYGVKNLLEYNSIINNFNKWEEYVLNQYSGSKHGKKVSQDKLKQKFAQCIMKTNNFDELFKCYNPKFGLENIFLSVITNFLIGPFEE